MNGQHVEILRISPQPGDLIVVRVSDDYAGDIRNIAENLKGVMEQVRAGMLVIKSGVKIEVLTKSELEALGLMPTAEVKALVDMNEKLRNHLALFQQIGRQVTSFILEHVRPNTPETEELHSMAMNLDKVLKPVDE